MGCSAITVEELTSEGNVSRMQVTQEVVSV